VRRHASPGCFLGLPHNRWRRSDSRSPNAVRQCRRNLLAGQGVAPARSVPSKRVAPHFRRAHPRARVPCRAAAGDAAASRRQWALGRRPVAGLRRGEAKPKQPAQAQPLLQGQAESRSGDRAPARYRFESGPYPLTISAPARLYGKAWPASSDCNRSLADCALLARFALRARRPLAGAALCSIAYS